MSAKPKKQAPAKKAVKPDSKKPAKKPSAKKKPDPKEIDPATGMRKRSLQGYGKIRPAEVSAAIVETRKEAKARGVAVVDVCPVDIRRDVMSAIMNKIKPERIADALDTLLSAKKVDLLGNMTPDYKAIDAGVKTYAQIMQIVGSKAPDEPADQSSQAEEELMKRITESKGAFNLLEQALKRAQESRGQKVIDAEILPTPTK